MNPAFSDALQLLAALEAAGHRAYLVGGCVRDRLLGREPADFDIATDALPEDVQKIFPRTVATGIRHGTVGVLQQGRMTEVTTFRREGGYSDRRRPDSVEFVIDLEQDLARRDFTVNAMAEDRHGRLYDPFGGCRDLERKMIRAVGLAEDRFREDALRMVRAIRFAAQLDFSIEGKTQKALGRAKADLAALAVERVTGELRRLLRSPRPSRGAEYLWTHRLIDHLPPFSRWEERIAEPPFPLPILDELDGEQVRWACFLAMCGIDRQTAPRRLKSFRLPAKETQQIAAILHLALDRGQTWTEEEAKRAILNHGWEAVRQGAELAGRLHGLPREETEREEHRLADWYREMPVRGIGELAVDGSDLIRASGKPSGPWVGEVLRELLIRTALGRIPNGKQRLIEEGCRLGKQDP